jgi:transcriptional regulator with XRE-family HTH domain
MGAESIGISKSTLSRLETGQRRPTLELLLALSQTYRVPLDDLGAHSRCASALCGAIWTTSWGCRAPQVVRLTPFSPGPRGSRLS